MTPPLWSKQNSGAARKAITFVAYSDYRSIAQTEQAFDRHAASPRFVRANR